MPGPWIHLILIILLAGATDKSVKVTDAAHLVKVGVYYSSRDPDAIHFISGDLYPTYQYIGDIMDIDLVPFGLNDYYYNPKNDSYVFHCYYGPDACKMNIIQTCANTLLKDPAVYLPFIYCMEELKEASETAAKACAVKYELNITQILDCSSSKMGNNLEYQMVEKTMRLSPRPTTIFYYPWITLNGVGSYKLNELIKQGFMYEVCKFYDGPPPAACKFLKDRA